MACIPILNIFIWNIIESFRIDYDKFNSYMYYTEKIYVKREK